MNSPDDERLRLALAGLLHDLQAVGEPLARLAKPLDTRLLDEFMDEHDILDAASGKTVRDAAKEGGRKQGPKNRQAPPDDVLRREVADLQAKGETLTNARRRVAKKHGLSLTTIRNHTK